MQVDLSYIPQVVSKHFYPLLIDRRKYLILYGGISSGKSVFVCQKLIYRILTDGVNHRILVVRKVSDKLRQSVFQEFVAVLKDWGLIHKATITTSPLQINLFGSTIIFSGLDDPEKIKSISRISGVWVEEATELEEKDFDELADRLRTDYNTYKQIILTFNPISQSHWIYSKFFESELLNDETTIDKSTYLDNDFINRDEWGKGLKLRYASNENAYRVKVLGEFGQDNKGGEIYHAFSIIKNYKKVVYDPERPLLLSFDFNTLPHSSLLVGQLVEGRIFIVDEIAGKHPLNRPAHCVKIFLKKYGDHLSGIWITGDASGKNESTRSEAGTNDYTNIFEALKDMRFVKNFVPSKNANVVQRLEFINHLFIEENILIDDRCQILYDDLVNLKGDNEGGKLKQKVKDKETGRTMEKYGHFSDCLDYMICTFLKDDFRKFLNGNSDFFSVGERTYSSNLY